MRLPPLVAAPLYLELGKRGYWFTPLKIRDWGTYEVWAANFFKCEPLEALKKADEAPEGMVFLVWLSLLHKQPTTLLSSVVNLLAKTGVIEQVNEKVIPFIIGEALTFTQQTTCPAKPIKEVDWSWVFYGLAEIYSFTAEQVSDMTLDQAMVYLSKGEPKSPRLMKFDTMGEAIQYINELKRYGKSPSDN